jgi:hypothetical protein
MGDLRIAHRHIDDFTPLNRMDELDRLFRRLVQNIRNGYPEYLSRPFEVSELYQTLIPYRHNRRELEIDTNQDYEMAICRLLAGERGYAGGDEAMQQAIREEIESPNPNTGIFREFAASRVQLVPEAMRQFEQSASADAIAREPTLATPPTPPARPRGAAQPAGAGGAMAPTARAAAPQPAAPKPAAPQPAAPQPAAPRASAQRPAAPSQPATSPQVVAPAAPAQPTLASMIAGTEAQGEGGGCRYCGGALPGGRRTVFCPHCGQNLTVQRCPACGSELEVGWKFCITCGRGIGTQ